MTPLTADARGLYYTRTREWQDVVRSTAHVGTPDGVLPSQRADVFKLEGWLRGQLGAAADAATELEERATREAAALPGFGFPRQRCVRHAATSSLDPRLRREGSGRRPAEQLRS